MRIKRVILLLIIIIAGIAAAIFYLNSAVITEQAVYGAQALPKSFMGYKIVHLSDIGNETSGIESQVNKQNPDIIIVSGNLADERGQVSNSVNLLNKLSKIAPTYYVFGVYDTESVRDTVRNSTSAIEITGTKVVIDAPEINVEQFIRETYGEEVYSKAQEGDEDSLLYIQYITETLEAQSNSKLVIMGIDTYELNQSGYTQARNDVFDLIKGNETDFLILVANQSELFDYVCDTGLDIMFSGNTLGVDKGNGYAKGLYNKSGCGLILSPGLHNDGLRIFNPKKIYAIELSDNSVKEENPLEKFIGKFYKVGNIFENDNGFQEYRYEYDSYGEIEDWEKER